MGNFRRKNEKIWREKNQNFQGKFRRKREILAGKKRKILGKNENFEIKRSEFLGEK